MTSIRRGYPAFKLDYARVEILEDALFEYHWKVGRLLRILKQDPHPSAADRQRLTEQAILEKNVAKLYNELGAIKKKHQDD